MLPINTREQLFKWTIPIEPKSNNNRALDHDAILAQLLTMQSERIGDIHHDEAYGEYQSKSRVECYLSQPSHYILYRLCRRTAGS